MIITIDIKPEDDITFGDIKYALDTYGWKMSSGDSMIYEGIELTREYSSFSIKAVPIDECDTES